MKAYDVGFANRLQAPGGFYSGEAVADSSSYQRRNGRGSKERVWLRVKHRQCELRPMAKHIACVVPVAAGMQNSSWLSRPNFIKGHLDRKRTT